MKIMLIIPTCTLNTGELNRIYKLVACNMQLNNQMISLASCLWSPGFVCPDTWARYWITFLVFSVFPAPDSPLTIATEQIEIKTDSAQHSSNKCKN